MRTHAQFMHSLSPQVTLVTGPNGSGKTSLIEALVIALRGTSFKGTDAEVLRHGADWWRIDTDSDEGRRTVKFDPSRPSGKKQFIIDDKTSYRLTTAHKYPVVLFEPDDLRLLSGSPTRRRDFIDRFIAQLDPLYAQALRKYDRALKQRNALLKTAQLADDDLFVWNVSLSEHGALIVQRRTQFIETINAQLDATYNTIAQSQDVVSVHYSHTVIDNVQQKMLGELHANLARDRILGYTSTGPHRHDILFRLNDRPATTVASRGEVRSIVLALKFLEVDLIEQLSGKAPLILLDDVFGELDSERQTHLATKFQGKQIIMTSASSTATLDDALVIELAG